MYVLDFLFCDSKLAVGLVVGCGFLSEVRLCCRACASLGGRAFLLVGDARICRAGMPARHGRPISWPAGRVAGEARGRPPPGVQNSHRWGRRGLFRRLVRNGFGGGTGPPARSLPADARRTEIRLRARLQLLRFYFEPLFWPRFPGRRRWRRVEGAQRAVPARAINRARSEALCYSRILSAVRAQQGALIVAAAATRMLIAPPPVLLH